MLIGQGALVVPDGTDVVEFVKHGGKPPEVKTDDEAKDDEPIRLSAFQGQVPGSSVCRVDGDGFQEAAETAGRSTESPQN